MNIDIKKLDKKTWFIITGIVLIITIAICVGYFYYLINKPTAEKKLTEEEIYNQQLKDLENLRKNIPPLTQDQINEQLKDLNKLYK